MKRLIILIITISLAFSCENDDTEPIEIINATITCIEKYTYSENYEEGEIVSCIVEPDVSDFYEFRSIPNDKWRFTYDPDFNYTGTESFTFISKKPNNNIKTIKLTIEVIQDDFRNKIIGKWKYIQTCGGYDGGCWDIYPNEILTVEFTEDMVYSKFINDDLIESHVYEFVDGWKSGESAIYAIQFDNDFTTYYKLSDDSLDIQIGDTIEEFVRISE
jgi:hypothetical protein